MFQGNEVGSFDQDSLIVLLFEELQGLFHSTGKGGFQREILKKSTQRIRGTGGCIVQDQYFGAIVLGESRLV